MVANAISTLVNQVESSIDSPISLIDGLSGTLPKHPKTGEITQVLSEINPANWMKLSFPYTFSVVDLRGGNVTNAEFTDFSLPLAPNAITQSEEPAIVITPTQGGTTVAHSGNRYKMLNIKGTTGLQPFRGTGGVKRTDGTAILQPNDLKHKSGFQVFLHLRNWFRAYYEYKKTDPTNAKNLRLVFKNYKDGEFLIVELLKFNMDRQAQRSFLYDYNLEFKVISHLTFTAPDRGVAGFIEDGINTALDYMDQTRGIFLRTQDILRLVESTYDAVLLDPIRRTVLALKALNGVQNVAADITFNSPQYEAFNNTDLIATLEDIKGKQEDNKRTGALDPRIAKIPLPVNIPEYVNTESTQSIIRNMGEGLMAMDSSDFGPTAAVILEQETEAAKKLPRKFYEDLLEEVLRIKRNLEDFLNLGDSTYDSLFDRSATLSSADLTKVPTKDEYDLLYAFNQMLAGLDALLATEDLFKSSLDDRIQYIINQFDNNIELFSTQASREIKIVKGATLERIAQQELGDSSRWGEIAELNNLKHPYIVEDKTEVTTDVLGVGDVLLLPAPLVNGFSETPFAKDIKTTVSLTDLEKSLGTDLLLTSTNDLSLSSTGDLEVVSGLENFYQQILLKLSYERGDVMHHPEIGAALEVGSKFPAIEDIRDGIVNTLQSDPRISEITSLALEREAGALYVTGTLKLKKNDTPIPLKIKVN